MRTKQDYLDSIGRLHAEVYAYGSRVTGLYDHPCFRPAMDAIGLTYELAQEPGNVERFTADSPFTGERVNRFLHIHQSRQDLLRRLRLARFMVRRHGACIGARCVATTALNALYAISYDMDCELGTGYHDRVRDFIRHVQENDLADAQSPGFIAYRNDAWLPRLLVAIPVDRDSGACWGLSGSALFVV